MPGERRRKGFVDIVSVIAITLILAISGGVLTSPPSLTGAATYGPGDCGKNVYENTVLSGDLAGCPGDGLTFNTSHITLDCQGHSILGTGIGTGINASYVTDITIKNCQVAGFLTGLVLNSTTDSFVYNSAFTGSFGDGIALYDSDNNDINWTNSTGSGDDGIEAYHSDSNTFAFDILLSNFNNGFHTKGSNSNLVMNCTINSTTGTPISTGIYIATGSGSSGNMIYDNYLYDFYYGVAQESDTFSGEDTESTKVFGNTFLCNPALSVGAIDGWGAVNSEIGQDGWGNDISGGCSYGVRLQTDSTGCKIEGNTITEASKAVYLLSGSIGNQVNYNVFEGNIEDVDTIPGNTFYNNWWKDSGLEVCDLDYPMDNVCDDGGDCPYSFTNGEDTGPYAEGCCTGYTACSGGSEVTCAGETWGTPTACVSAGDPLDQTQTASNHQGDSFGCDGASTSETCVPGYYENIPSPGCQGDYGTYGCINGVIFREGVGCGTVFEDCDMGCGATRDIDSPYSYDPATGECQWGTGCFLTESDIDPSGCRGDPTGENCVERDWGTTQTWYTSLDCTASGPVYQSQYVERADYCDYQTQEGEYAGIDPTCTDCQESGTRRYQDPDAPGRCTGTSANTLIEQYAPGDACLYENQPCVCDDTQCAADISGGTCQAMDGDTVCMVGGEVCGDGVCEGGETCSNCPADCGVCPVEEPAPAAPVDTGGGGGTIITEPPAVTEPTEPTEPTVPQPPVVEPPTLERDNQLTVRLVGDLASHTVSELDNVPFDTSQVAVSFVVEGAYDPYTMGHYDDYSLSELVTDIANTIDGLATGSIPTPWEIYAITNLKAGDTPGAGQTGEGYFEIGGDAYEGEDPLNPVGSMEMPAGSGFFEGAQLPLDVIYDNGVTEVDGPLTAIIYPEINTNTIHIVTAVGEGRYSIEFGIRLDGILLYSDYWEMTGPLLTNDPLRYDPTLWGGGEYTFYYRVYDGSGQLVSQVDMDVDIPLPGVMPEGPQVTETVCQDTITPIQGSSVFEFQGHDSDCNPLPPEIISCGDAEAMGYDGATGYFQGCNEIHSGFVDFGEGIQESDGTWHVNTDDGLVGVSIDNGVVTVTDPDGTVNVRDDGHFGFTDGTINTDINNGIITITDGDDSVIVDWAGPSVTLDGDASIVPGDGITYTTGNGNDIFVNPDGSITVTGTDGGIFTIWPTDGGPEVEDDDGTLDIYYGVDYDGGFEVGDGNNYFYTGIDGGGPIPITIIKIIPTTTWFPFPIPFPIECPFCPGVCKKPKFSNLADQEGPPPEEPPGNTPGDVSRGNPSGGGIGDPCGPGAASTGMVPARPSGGGAGKLESSVMGAGSAGNMGQRMGQVAEGVGMAMQSLGNIMGGGGGAEMMGKTGYLAYYSPFNTGLTGLVTGMQYGAQFGLPQPAESLSGGSAASRGGSSMPSSTSVPSPSESLTNSLEGSTNREKADVQCEPPGICSMGQCMEVCDFHTVWSELFFGVPMGAFTRSGAYMAVHNPTPDTVKLHDHYVSYLSSPGKIELDGGKGAEFRLKFPEGAEIEEGEELVIAFNGRDFERMTSEKADFEVIPTDPDVPDMTLVMLGGISMETDNVDVVPEEEEGYVNPDEVPEYGFEEFENILIPSVSAQEDDLLLGGDEAGTEEETGPPSPDAVLDLYGEIFERPLDPEKGVLVLSLVIEDGEERTEEYVDVVAWGIGSLEIDLEPSSTPAKQRDFIPVRYREEKEGLATIIMAKSGDNDAIRLMNFGKETAALDQKNVISVFTGDKYYYGAFAGKVSVPSGGTLDINFGEAILPGSASVPEGQVDLPLDITGSFIASAQEEDDAPEDDAPVAETTDVPGDELKAHQSLDFSDFLETEEYEFGHRDLSPMEVILLEETEDDELDIIDIVTYNELLPEEGDVFVQMPGAILGLASPREEREEDFIQSVTIIPPVPLEKPRLEEDDQEVSDKILEAMLSMDEANTGPLVYSYHRIGLDELEDEAGALSGEHYSTRGHDELSEPFSVTWAMVPVSPGSSNPANFFTRNGRTPLTVTEATGIGEVGDVTPMTEAPYLPPDLVSEDEPSAGGCTGPDCPTQMVCLDDFCEETESYDYVPYEASIWLAAILLLPTLFGLTRRRGLALLAVVALILVPLPAMAQEANILSSPEPLSEEAYLYTSSIVEDAVNEVITPEGYESGFDIYLMESIERENLLLMQAYTDKLAEAASDDAYIPEEEQEELLDEYGFSVPDYDIRFDLDWRGDILLQEWHDYLIATEEQLADELDNFGIVVPYDRPEGEAGEVPYFEALHLIGGAGDTITEELVEANFNFFPYMENVVWDEEEERVACVKTETSSGAGQAGAGRETMGARVSEAGMDDYLGELARNRGSATEPAEDDYMLGWHSHMVDSGEYIRYMYDYARDVSQSASEIIRNQQAFIGDPDNQVNPILGGFEGLSSSLPVKYFSSTVDGQDNPNSIPNMMADALNSMYQLGGLYKGLVDVMGAGLGAGYEGTASYWSFKNIGSNYWSSLSRQDNLWGELDAAESELEQTKALLDSVRKNDPSNKERIASLGRRVGELNGQVSILSGQTSSGTLAGLGAERLSELIEDQEKEVEDLKRTHGRLAEQDSGSPEEVAAGKALLDAQKRLNNLRNGLDDARNGYTSEETSNELLRSMYLENKAQIQHWKAEEIRAKGQQEQYEEQSKDLAKQIEKEKNKGEPDKEKIKELEEAKKEADKKAQDARNDLTSAKSEVIRLERQASTPEMVLAQQLQFQAEEEERNDPNWWGEEGLGLSKPPGRESYLNWKEMEGNIKTTQNYISHTWIQAIGVSDLLNQASEVASQLAADGFITSEQLNQIQSQIEEGKSAVTEGMNDLSVATEAVDRAEQAAREDFEDDGRFSENDRNNNARNLAGAAGQAAEAIEKIMKAGKEGIKALYYAIVSILNTFFDKVAEANTVSIACELNPEEEDCSVKCQPDPSWWAPCEKLDFPGSEEGEGGGEGTAQGGEGGEAAQGGEGGEAAQGGGDASPPAGQGGGSAAVVAYYPGFSITGAVQFGPTGDPLGGSGPVPGPSELPPSAGGGVAAGEGENGDAVEVPPALPTPSGLPSDTQEAVDAMVKAAQEAINKALEAIGVYASCCDDEAQAESSVNNCPKFPKLQKFATDVQKAFEPPDPSEPPSTAGGRRRAASESERVAEAHVNHNKRSTSRGLATSSAGGGKYTPSGDITSTGKPDNTQSRIRPNDEKILYINGQRVTDMQVDEDGFQIVGKFSGGGQPTQWKTVFRPTTTDDEGRPKYLTPEDCKEAEEKAKELKKDQAEMNKEMEEAQKELEELERQLQDLNDRLADINDMDDVNEALGKGEFQMSDETKGKLEGLTAEKSALDKKASDIQGQLDKVPGERDAAKEAAGDKFDQESGLAEKIETYDKFSDSYHSILDPLGERIKGRNSEIESIGTELGEVRQRLEEISGIYSSDIPDELDRALNSERDALRKREKSLEGERAKLEKDNEEDKKEFSEWEQKQNEALEPLEQEIEQLEGKKKEALDEVDREYDAKERDLEQQKADTEKAADEKQAEFDETLDDWKDEQRKPLELQIAGIKKGLEDYKKAFDDQAAPILRILEKCDLERVLKNIIECNLKGNGIVAVPVGPVADVPGKPGVVGPVNVDPKTGDVTVQDPTTGKSFPLCGPQEGSEGGAEATGQVTGMTVAPEVPGSPEEGVCTPPEAPLSLTPKELEEYKDSKKRETEALIRLQCERLKNRKEAGELLTYNEEEYLKKCTTHLTTSTLRRSEQECHGKGFTRDEYNKVLEEINTRFREGVARLPEHIFRCDSSGSFDRCMGTHGHGEDDDGPLDEYNRLVEEKNNAIRKLNEDYNAFKDMNNKGCQESKYAAYTDVITDPEGKKSHTRVNEIIRNEKVELEEKLTQTIEAFFGSTQLIDLNILVGKQKETQDEIAAAKARIEALEEENKRMQETIEESEKEIARLKNEFWARIIGTTASQLGGVAGGALPSDIFVGELTTEKLTDSVNSIGIPVIGSVSNAIENIGKLRSIHSRIQELEERNGDMKGAIEKNAKEISDTKGKKIPELESELKDLSKQKQEMLDGEGSEGKSLRQKIDETQKKIDELTAEFNKVIDEARKNAKDAMSHVPESLRGHYEQVIEYLLSQNRNEFNSRIVIAVNNNINKMVKFNFPFAQDRQFDPKTGKVTYGPKYLSPTYMAWLKTLFFGGSYQGREYTGILPKMNSGYTKDQCKDIETQAKAKKKELEAEQRRLIRKISDTNQKIEDYCQEDATVRAALEKYSESEGTPDASKNQEAYDKAWKDCKSRASSEMGGPEYIEQKDRLELIDSRLKALAKIIKEAEECPTVDLVSAGAKLSLLGYVNSFQAHRSIKDEEYAKLLVSMDKKHRDLAALTQTYVRAKDALRGLKADSSNVLGRKWAKYKNLMWNIIGPTGTIVSELTRGESEGGWDDLASEIMGERSQEDIDLDRIIERTQALLDSTRANLTEKKSHANQQASYYDDDSVRKLYIKLLASFEVDPNDRASLDREYEQIRDALMMAIRQELGEDSDPNDPDAPEPPEPERDKELNDIRDIVLRMDSAATQSVISIQLYQYGLKLEDAKYASRTEYVDDYVLEFLQGIFEPSEKLHYEAVDELVSEKDMQYAQIGARANDFIDHIINYQCNSRCMQDISELHNAVDGAFTPAAQDAAIKGLLDKYGIPYTNQQVRDLILFWDRGGSLRVKRLAGTARNTDFVYTYEQISNDKMYYGTVNGVSVGNKGEAGYYRSLAAAYATGSLAKVLSREAEDLTREEERSTKFRNFIMFFDLTDVFTLSGGLILKIFSSEIKAAFKAAFRSLKIAEKFGRAGAAGEELLKVVARLKIARAADAKFLGRLGMTAEQAQSLLKSLRGMESLEDLRAFLKMGGSLEKGGDVSEDVILMLRAAQDASEARGLVRSGKLLGSFPDAESFIKALSAMSDADLDAFIRAIKSADSAADAAGSLKATAGIKNLDTLEDWVLDSVMTARSTELANQEKLLKAEITGRKYTNIFSRPLEGFFAASHIQDMMSQIRASYRAMGQATTAAEKLSHADNILKLAKRINSMGVAEKVALLAAKELAKEALKIDELDPVLHAGIIRAADDLDDAIAIFKVARDEYAKAPTKAAGEFLDEAIDVMMFTKRRLDGAITAEIAVQFRYANGGIPKAAIRKGVDEKLLEYRARESDSVRSDLAQEVSDGKMSKGDVDSIRANARQMASGDADVSEFAGMEPDDGVHFTSEAQESLEQAIIEKIYRGNPDSLTKDARKALREMVVRRRMNRLRVLLNMERRQIGSFSTAFGDLSIAGRNKPLEAIGGDYNLVLRTDDGEYMIMVHGDARSHGEGAAHLKAIFDMHMNEVGGRLDAILPIIIHLDSAEDVSADILKFLRGVDKVDDDLLAIIRSGQLADSFPDAGNFIRALGGLSDGELKAFVNSVRSGESADWAADMIRAGKNTGATGFKALFALDPQSVLASVERLYTASAPKGQFMTVSAAVVRRGNEVTLVQAGEPLVILRASEGYAPDLQRGMGGIAFGGAPSAMRYRLPTGGFKVTTLTLGEGDIIFHFSDGLSEAGVLSVDLENILIRNEVLSAIRSASSADEAVGMLRSGSVAGLSADEIAGAAGKLSGNEIESFIRYVRGFDNMDDLTAALKRSRKTETGISIPLDFSSSGRFFESLQRAASEGLTPQEFIARMLADASAYAKANGVAFFDDISMIVIRAEKGPVYNLDDVISSVDRIDELLPSKSSTVRVWMTIEETGERVPMTIDRRHALIFEAYNRNLPPSEGFAPGIFEGGDVRRMGSPQEHLMSRPEEGITVRDSSDVDFHTPQEVKNTAQYSSFRWDVMDILDDHDHFIEMGRELDDFDVTTFRDRIDGVSSMTISRLQITTDGRILGPADWFNDFTRADGRPYLRALEVEGGDIVVGSKKFHFENDIFRVLRFYGEHTAEIDPDTLSALRVWLGEGEISNILTLTDIEEIRRFEQSLFIQTALQKQVIKMFSHAGGARTLEGLRNFFPELHDFLRKAGYDLEALARGDIEGGLRGLSRYRMAKPISSPGDISNIFKNIFDNIGAAPTPEEANVIYLLEFGGDEYRSLTLVERAKLVETFQARMWGARLSGTGEGWFRKYMNYKLVSMNNLDYQDLMKLIKRGEVELPADILEDILNRARREAIPGWQGLLSVTGRSVAVIPETSDMSQVLESLAGMKERRETASISIIREKLRLLRECRDYPSHSLNQRIKMLTELWYNVEFELSEIDLLAIDVETLIKTGSSTSTLEGILGTGSQRAAAESLKPL